MLFMVAPSYLFAGSNHLDGEKLCCTALHHHHRKRVDPLAVAPAPFIYSVMRTWERQKESSHPITQKLRKFKFISMEERGMLHCFARTERERVIIIRASTWLNALPRSKREQLWLLLSWRSVETCATHFWYNSWNLNWPLAWLKATLSDVCTIII